MPSWTGPALIVFVLVVAIPVGVLISGGIFAAILGTVAKRDVDARFEGTEHLDLGR